MGNSARNLGYVALIGAAALLAVEFNDRLVTATHSAASLAIGQDNADRPGIPIPDDLVSAVERGLAQARSLSPNDRLAARAALPDELDYEYTARPPWPNIFDFSVFDRPGRRGGILLVGDSTVSWGFSAPHLAALSAREVHALTWGRNPMDESLLEAVDRIVECYWDEPPAVMVSNSLRALESPERLRRAQDRALAEITAAGNCESLFDLVAARRASGDSAAREPGEWSTFDGYRQRLSGLLRSPVKLRHARLHEIMEPAKFAEPGRTDLYFYRWRPEFRIPFLRDGGYARWRPHTRSAGRSGPVDSPDQTVRIQAAHRAWMDRQACFVIPLTMRPESEARLDYIGSDRACVIDFNAIAAADGGELDLPLQGSQHLAVAGGIVLASIVGKYLRNADLPVWRR
jgi:hypothetical protein